MMLGENDFILYIKYNNNLLVFPYTENTTLITLNEIRLHASLIFYSMLHILEIVFTRAAPAFHNLLMVMGCVFDINTVHKTIEKLTFQAFY